MIKVFGQTDKIFTSNGDVVLRPLKAKVRKEDNGQYYLDYEGTYGRKVPTYIVFNGTTQYGLPT